MKRKRFSVEQIVAVLKRAEGSVAEACRQVGITEEILYRWKEKFVGLPPPSGALSCAVRTK